MKKILGVYSAPGQHWVGDGFPVRSLFSYNSHGRHMSPFLLLDYAGPSSFTPTTDRRGVGEHPHRGFETVTIVYRGEVQHRDSTGAGGTIGAGDVQWMTAGAGILHEEFHSKAFARSGGTLDMVQLWVNLPAKDKMTAPGYQTLLRRDIPVVDLPEGAGSVRVIAGEFGGRTGPAHTFSPLDVWDLRLQQGRGTRLAFKAGRTAALVVLHGTVQVNGSEVVREAQLVVLDRDAGELVLEADSEATLLVLSGEPIDEPIVGYGPFVMNTQEEIGQAIADFKSGKLGVKRESRMQAKVREPQQMNATFAAAYNSGDIENLMALYEPNAVLVPQPGLRAIGLAAIREALLGLLGQKGKMQSENVYCIRTGDLALLQASWKLSAIGADGKPFELSSRTAEVVRQQPDESWLYVVDHAFANDS
jgi:quercetin 2,3-dioxygenase